ncbi:twin-arginine translocase TatA/TatE family subunit [Fodinicola feengrottensis]|uniref:twin-arginine translocase TatA/TatE family subunit n=1 Tax=Fodinicola feengrottensis TaxID=435914 RepID=UPI002442BD9A|nr:twin-arginine translocase TatA/TatE family subunit [Fodinicola feengrottensis]
MLDNLDFTKVILLLVVAMLVVGPQRLPGLIESAARLLRGARDMARTANTQLQQELGVDLDVTDLNPRTFVRKHLLTDDDDEMPCSVRCEMPWEEWTKLPRP